MRRKLLTAACLLSLSGVASAHRLDEYLQATILSVEQDHLQASMRLIPGVAVASTVIAAIDSNGDGILTPAEQRAYAEKVIGDLTLQADGQPLKPKLLSANFPDIDQMREGMGEIDLDFAADLPPGGPNRKITLENPQRPNSVYLINCLLPRDPNIHIVAQKRNQQQSVYEVDYEQSGAQPSSATPVRWSTASTFGFGSIFRLGVRHIAEGPDHLLFLLTLLLPAALLAAGSRWSAVATIRDSLRHILTIVTAFTLGHSITLACAAFGLVRIPSRPIEILIAVSILLSAIHALRPIFPGREAAIAAFFGLIHGLAFATTLGELGLSRWQLVGGLLAFNLGIETMQMIVVATTMPSLILMSRTRAYPYLRISGALFAGIASVGWIAQRLFNTSNQVDPILNAAVRHAPGIAVILFLISIACWRVDGLPGLGPMRRPVGSRRRQPRTIFATRNPFPWQDVAWLRKRALITPDHHDNAPHRRT